MSELHVSTLRSSLYVVNGYITDLQKQIAVMNWRYEQLQAERQELMAEIEAKKTYEPPPRPS